MSEETQQKIKELYKYKTDLKITKHF